MTKPEVLKAIVEKVENMDNGIVVSQKQVKAILAAYADVILETLTRDKEERIIFENLGTFKVKHIPEKSGVSAFGDKKTWVKPEHDELTFKVASPVKELN